MRLNALNLIDYDELPRTHEGEHAAVLTAEQSLRQSNNKLQLPFPAGELLPDWQHF